MTIEIDDKVVQRIREAEQIQKELKAEYLRLGEEHRRYATAGDQEMTAKLRRQMDDTENRSHKARDTGDGLLWDIRRKVIQAVLPATKKF